LGSNRHRAGFWALLTTVSVLTAAGLQISGGFPLPGSTSARPSRDVLVVYADNGTFTIAHEDNSGGDNGGGDNGGDNGDFDPNARTCGDQRILSTRLIVSMFVERVDSTNHGQLVIGYAVRTNAAAWQDGQLSMDPFLSAADINKRVIESAKSLLAHQCGMSFNDHTSVILFGAATAAP
jgi:hypothetical protein